MIERQSSSLDTGYGIRYELKQECKSKQIIVALKISTVD